MQPSHNNDDLNKKNNFPENENKFSQNHTPITTFEKLAIKEIIPIFSNNNVKKCLMAWKECFKADPRTFFILTYNMMTMNYRDYWVLLKKHLNIEDENILYTSLLGDSGYRIFRPSNGELETVHI